MTDPHRVDRLTRAACLVAGPILYAASTPFWQVNGSYGVTGGTLLMVGMVPWLYGLLGVFDAVRLRSRWYATIGSLALLYGAASGVAFGVRGFYVDAFSLSHATDLTTLGQYAWQSNVIFFWSGPLFPLSLLVLGVVLAALRLVTWLTGASVAVVGVIFPLVSTVRFELGPASGPVLFGLLMVVAFTPLAWEYGTGRIHQRGHRTTPQLQGAS